MSPGSPWRFSLLLLLLLPAIFFYFGGRMALYRAEQRALGEKITAEVIEQRRETFTSKGADGERRSGEHFAYTVRFDIAGDLVTRPVLEANYDPERIFHTSDEVDPKQFPVGSQMPLLMRRDLGFAVSPDLFWTAYLIPAVLLGFGAFTLLMTGAGIAIMWPR